MNIKFKYLYTVLTLSLMVALLYIGLRFKKNISPLNQQNLQRQISKQHKHQTQRQSQFNNINPAENKISQKNSIENILTLEEKNIYNFSDSTHAQNSRLKQIADTFNNADLLMLKKYVLSSQISSDQRFLALHFLILKSPGTHYLLTDIFYTDHALLNRSVAGHSVDEAQKEIELNLRMLAIEQIEKNIFMTRHHQNPLKLELRYNELKNSYLKSLLSIVQTSEKLNTPLLSQFISSAFNGVN